MENVLYIWTEIHIRTDVCAYRICVFVRYPVESCKLLFGFKVEIVNLNALFFVSCSWKGNFFSSPFERKFESECKARVELMFLLLSRRCLLIMMSLSDGHFYADSFVFIWVFNDFFFLDFFLIILCNAIKIEFLENDKCNGCSTPTFPHIRFNISVLTTYTLKFQKQKETCIIFFFRSAQRWKWCTAEIC